MTATLQQLRTGVGGYVGMDLLVTRSDGSAVPCHQGKLDVSVEVSRGGGPFTRVPAGALHLACTPPGQGDAALVMDNSGSESGFLADLKTGAHHMVNAIVPAGGRVSLVRVSTNATVELPLSADPAAIDEAVDGMFINGGYTALYDGVRMANETLGGAVVVPDDATQYSDVASFCSASRKLGIVLFTDGRENNSADEQAPNLPPGEYPGDGMNTTLADLGNLRVNGVTTPIYTVGLGDDVDHEGLAQLAAQTGGRHKRIDDPADLAGVFDVIADYFQATHQVCADLPLDECGDVTMRVRYDWRGPRGEKASGDKLVNVHIPCPRAPQGRMATALLTWSNPGLTRQLAGTLASGLVDWASPGVPTPTVLVVRDDNHHDEFKNDPLYVRDLLTERGYSVRFLDEPSDGLELADLGDADVVWFSNPGYPMDDLMTRETLLSFSELGGGVVLQGDDMSWSWGAAFSLAPLTHLDHVHNGTSFCGKTTDNNAGARYRVSFAAAPHPAIAGLEGQSFTYGDDIDHATPRGEGEAVLATARLDQSACTDSSPVITVYDPTP